MPRNKEDKEGKKELRWEKKKEKAPDDVEEAIQEYEDTTSPDVAVQAKISYNAGQFLVRLPREVASVLGLQDREDEEQYFKFYLEVDKFDKKDKIIPGRFEVEKK